MSKMYKSDPTQPKPEPIANTGDSKITELETKLRRLTEQFTKLQTDFMRLSRSVRRQTSDISTLSNRVNRVK